MVHRVDPVYESPKKTCWRNSKVKSEVVDSIDDQFCSLSKRPKFDYSNQEEGISQYNPLDEPSPLGLKLKKSPSFLDLIQMKLSQERSASLGKTLAKKEKGGPEKIKASNFPATLLTIGSWEYKSRYEGDLVAKCYFAKHKLVWEVLDGGLKNKIEIQWSDIMAIKATYPDDGLGTLDVVLSRQPLFFREINPQPRKHTLWQATSDFTSGQATINRRHFLQFPQGMLGKHFEKLMQCDPRLRFLSQQPEIVLDTPYFQSIVPSFGDRDLTLNLMTSTFSGFKDTISVSGLSSDFENTDTVDTSSPQRNPSSATEKFLLEGESRRKVEDLQHGLGLLNQIKVPGLHTSMSVGDLVNHIGECISEQMRSDNPNLSINDSQKKDLLEEITQYLLSDSQATTPVYDERRIMSRVDSLCCLLQKDSNGVHNLHDKCDYLLNDRAKFDLTEKLPALNGETGVVNSGCKEGGPSMMRKDSVDELLLNLPRIASLPQFLMNAHEESVYGGR